jgi:hypothetical protein
MAERVARSSVFERRSERTRAGAFLMRRKARRNVWRDRRAELRNDSEQESRETPERRFRRRRVVRRRARRGNRAPDDLTGREDEGEDGKLPGKRRAILR